MKTKPGLQDLILKLSNDLGDTYKEELNKITDLKEKDQLRNDLLAFITKIYPKVKKSTLSIIKEIYIYSAENNKEADEITLEIYNYLNNSAQFRRITALEIIYQFYYQNFVPSGKTIKILSTSLIDGISISAEMSPSLDLSKGYKLLTSLGITYGDEILPLMYEALKNPSHPCRIKFMELIGNIKFEHTLWLERLTPFLVNFLSSGKDDLILTAIETIKKQLQYFPCLLSRFVKPVIDLLNSKEEKIQEEISELILEISLLHREILLDTITILIKYVKDTKKSQKSIISIGTALTNLLKDNDNHIKQTLDIISPSSVTDEEEDISIWPSICSKVLEEAMINQQLFSVKEFLWIFGPDIFKDVLAGLILNIHGERGSFLGLYHEKNWITSDGRMRFAHTDQIFTIAHPLDIFFANQITVWQKIIMEKKIKQSFQQVFRSLYSLHMDEITELESHRFGNQQVITEKVKKAFFEENFSLKDNYAFYNWKDSHIQAKFIWDRENTANRGISVTGQIQFHKILNLKEHTVDDKRMSLWQIDPRIFSETIRKLELVISRGIFRKSFF